jgi:hypothetical protein
MIRAASRAWVRMASMGRAGTRAPVGLRVGLVRSVMAVVPMVGSWLRRWTASSRRLAEKPICRRAGRLHSRLPMPKSRLSLMVVSVRRARSSLWYCLIFVFL